MEYHIEVESGNKELNENNDVFMGSEVETVDNLQSDTLLGRAKRGTKIAN